MGIQINGNTDTISAIDGGLTVSGADLGVSAGSTAAPSISPTGDSNTGIFFPSADTVAIAEGGTEVLRVDSNGRLGIGSATPGFQVTVDQGTTDGNLVDIKNEEVRLLTGVWGTGATYPREITLNATRFDSGTVPALRLAGQGGIKFAVDLNTVRMEIDSSGRVTMPYQPAFYTVHTANNGINQQNTTVILTAPIINRGSAYSTSTGRYTCPVAGLYQFFFGTIKSDNGIAPDPRVSRFNIRKNGTNASTELRLSENGGYGESASLVCLVECVANDFIDVFITDTGGWYGNNYSHFGGFLIG